MKLSQSLSEFILGWIWWVQGCLLGFKPSKMVPECTLALCSLVSTVCVPVCCQYFTSSLQVAGIVGNQWCLFSPFWFHVLWYCSSWGICMGIILMYMQLFLLLFLLHKLFSYSRISCMCIFGYSKTVKGITRQKLTPSPTNLASLFKIRFSVVRLPVGMEVGPSFSSQYTPEVILVQFIFLIV